jgi:alpha-galactosidase
MAHRSRLTLCALAVVAACFFSALASAEEPKASPSADDSKVILTPKPGPAPQINGPRLFGVRPGHPFLYRIPCTGKRPMRFVVDNLPPGMRLDGAKGVIRGRAPKEAGDYVITLRARNDHGTAAKEFTIAVGDTLALTPPMGWNSWYIHFNTVSEKHMRGAADAMVASGMADVGYMYVNIDDCWMKRQGNEPYRADDGTILCNERFPDIEGMVDYIHAKGLRAGLYTSPGPWTCGRYVGSYQHEKQDAETFARWGFDFLKYDWCSYGKVATGKGLDRLQRPYRKMGDILQGLDRDIVLNLCQYGMGDVWKWGAEVGGHCWRTTGDLGWAKADRLPGFYKIGLSNAQHWEYAGPGAWNDPDYLILGMIGDHDKYVKELRAGKIPEIVYHPTPLSGNEQYSQMSMWCLMAAPLVFSGDMAQLDPFTVNILCNPEVIAVDQDALGRQAHIVRRTDDDLVMAKPLEDGSLAVGLFNLRDEKGAVAIDWNALEIEGPRIARDLWRHKDLGTFADRFRAAVPGHGVLLLRLRVPKAE